VRVVSGKAKGRNLLAVPGDTTRPILDRVKTALFDVLRPTLPGTSILDLFAGSGSVGIEALSQGAEHCTFIDLARAATETIRKNLATTGLTEQAEVRNTDAFLFLEKNQRAFDLIYIAPPQYKALWVEALRALAERPETLSPNGQIIVQIDPEEYEPVELSNFQEVSKRTYGKTVLVFFQPLSACVQ
jgi:16S rRNA (guanine966-N2)-methyltransferase